MSKKNDLTATRPATTTADDDLPTVAPAVDIYETDEAFGIRADLPGLDVKDLKVHVDDGQLVVEGKRHFSPSGSPVFREWRPLAFERTFLLPNGIDTERISAELEGGVLRLILPKSEALRPRDIPVRAS